MLFRSTTAAAYITANIIKSPPNDEVLLKQILDSEDFANKKEKAEEHGKQVFEVCVSPESFLDGKIKAMGSFQTALLPRPFLGFRTAPLWPADSYSLLS